MKITWRREWQPTPVFLPGEFHGQRRLEGYSPWGHKESDMAGQLTHTEAPEDSGASFSVISGSLCLQDLRIVTSSQLTI